MKEDGNRRYLIIASLGESLLNFRMDFIRSLLARNIEVHVAAPCLDSNSSVFSGLVAEGVVVHNVLINRTGMNPFGDMESIISIIRLLVRVKPTWMLCYTIKPIVYGMIAGMLCRIPRRYALVTGLGYSFVGGTGLRRKVASWVSKALYRFACGAAHLVFFQNPDDESYFRNAGLLKSAVKSVVVNGSGVNTQRFRVTDIKDGPIRFLLIARLLGDKGVREYVRAALSVKTQSHNADFCLVGWIDDNPDSISKDELDQWIASGITYLGRLDDVREAISNASVFVLPSYREGTPRTVLEAMAMGRPVITTDVPGCRETVIEGYNGYLVPAKSVDELAAAMMRFISNPSLVFDMGANARRVAEDKYDVHKVNSIMLREMGLE